MLVIYLFVTINLLAFAAHAKTDKKDRTLKIALIGDSLVQQPVDHNGLIQKLQNNLPHYDLTIKSFAVGASFIENIRKEQIGPALKFKPDVVLLLW